MIRHIVGLALVLSIMVASPCSVFAADEPLRIGGLRPVTDNPLEQFDARSLMPDNGCGEVTADWEVDKGAKIIWADGQNISPATTVNAKKQIRVRYDTAALNKNAYAAVSITCTPTDPQKPAKNLRRTPFFVELIARCSNNQEISVDTENDKREIYVQLYANTTFLGVLANLDINFAWSSGIEMMGQLCPDDLRASDFTASEFDAQGKYSERIWVNNNQVSSSDDVPDNPLAYTLDTTPSDTGKIFNWDKPSDPPGPAQADLKAVRLKFTWYFRYQGTRCCNIVYWFVRTTLRTLAGGDQYGERDNDSTLNANQIGTTTATNSSVLEFNMREPIVSGITPGCGQRGTQVPITNLAGNRFVKTPTIRLKKSGVTITATDAAVESKSKMTCAFTIPADADVGNWDVEVVNPDNQAGILYGGFTVTE